MGFKPLGSDNNDDAQTLIGNPCTSRIPPCVWQLLGFCIPFISIYINTREILIFAGVMFGLYGIANVWFNVLTLTSEYVVEPNNLSTWDFLTITNIKYKPQYQTPPPNPCTIMNGATPSQNMGINEPPQQLLIYYEVITYKGTWWLIKYALWVIYVLGITDKNYIWDDTPVCYWTM